MKPSIPPSVLALVCRDESGKKPTYAEQAEKLGKSPRQFARMITWSWADWNVAEAEDWCAICGVDLWDMNGLADRLKEIDWTKLKPGIRRALADLLRLHGVKPKSEKLDTLASALKATNG